MRVEQNDKWHTIEAELRLNYGNEGLRCIIEDPRWRHYYCERRKKLNKQIARHRKFFIKTLVYPSPLDDPKKRKTKNRKNGQRSRRMMSKFSRQFALERLAPIDNVADLVSKLSWHLHQTHIWAVATYPGVTSTELTDCLGILSSNHRMVFRRLNNDLYHLGWQFVSCQVGAQNEPWGWYLEKI
ncbi:hypothetical protein ACK32O_16280 [Aeromonas enteropelogenes]|uniref:hypothetical protein n=1 Tax=Aeromonas enteropelogenes TaxID=29489 RepID=UPI003986F77A